MSLRTMSSTRRARRLPRRMRHLYRGNFWATIRLLNALRDLNRPVRVTLAGSAAELGPVPPGRSAGCRVLSLRTRSTPTAGASRLATIAGLAERPPLEVSVARVFNPIGPGMPPTQAFGEFAAAALRGGSRSLAADRRRISKPAAISSTSATWPGALIAVSLRGKPGLVYHVGTGQSRSVGEGLELLIQLSGRLVRICIDPSRHIARAPSIPRRHQTHRHPHRLDPAIPFEQSLADLWEELVPAGHGAPERTASLLPLTA